LRAAARKAASCPSFVRVKSRPLRNHLDADISEQSARGEIQQSKKPAIRRRYKAASAAGGADG
jgi:hypothetical protein